MAAMPGRNHDAFHLADKQDYGRPFRLSPDIGGGGSGFPLPEGIVSAHSPGICPGVATRGQESAIALGRRLPFSNLINQCRGGQPPIYPLLINTRSPMLLVTGQKSG